MRVARPTILFACSLLLWGCTKPASDDPPGGGGGGGGGDTPVDASVRMAWGQDADSAAALASLRFVMYVDGGRRELPNATCSTTIGGDGYPCSSPLPAMSAGRHTLELASYTVDGGTVAESGKSVSIAVNATTPIGLTTGTTAEARVPGATVELSSRARPRELTTSDGARLGLEVVTAAEGTTAIAVAADGTALIGYGAGRLRVVRNARTISDEALASGGDADGAERAAILDLALDPQFGRNHLVYVLDVSASDVATFRLLRFREAGGRLGERAVLLDRIPAARLGPAAALTFGTDGRLYIGFDDADNPAEAERAGSYSGKILRLNSDASVPAEEQRTSPIYATNFRSPGSLAWDADSASLWVAEPKRGVVRRLQRNAAGQIGESVYALSPAERPASLVMYRSARIPSLRRTLLIALTGQQDYLVRARPTADGSGLTTIERLRIPGGLPVRLVDAAPDGSLYLATTREVLRLTPR